MVVNLGCAYFNLYPGDLFSLGTFNHDWEETGCESRFNSSESTEYSTRLNGWSFAKLMRRLFDVQLILIAMAFYYLNDFLSSFGRLILREEV